MLDYQLAEEVAGNEAVRLVLRVSPSIGRLDEAAVRETLLRELGRGSMLGAYHARMWEGAGTIEIQRIEPVATQGGKVLPLQLLKQDAARG